MITEDEKDMKNKTDTTRKYVERAINLSKSSKRASWSELARSSKEAAGAGIEPAPESEPSKS